MSWRNGGGGWFRAVAMTRRVSDRARPIVLVPTSRPISRCPAGTASRNSIGSSRIMIDDNPQTVRS